MYSANTNYKNIQMLKLHAFNRHVLFVSKFRWFPYNPDKQKQLCFCGIFCIHCYKICSTPDTMVLDAKIVDITIVDTKVVETNR